MPDSPGARRASVRLRVRSGPDQGRELLLSGRKEALLGRGRATDLRLTDPTVSQKHCLVRAAGDLAILEDLKGANGTWVGGQKVAQHVFDRNGVFLIGQTEVEVSWVADEEKPSSAAGPDPARATTVTMQKQAAPPAAAAAGDPITVFDASAAFSGVSGEQFEAARKLVGTTVGGYTLEKVIGMGGMGAVYRARGAEPGAQVAVKIIHRARARHAGALSRFLREARAGMALEHPNVVKTITSGEDGPYAYIVMELVQGRDLAALLAEGKRFSVAEAVAVAAAICDALATAHLKGIIHRDIKPENIVLTPEGVPKLLDLGLVKTDEQGQSILTATGDVMGTPSYMSPEQATDSKHVDARTDVYSLAATIYTVLSTHPPFDGKTSIEVLRKVRRTPAPPLRDQRPDVPAALARVIEQGLAKEPAERFSTMAEFARALKTAAKKG